MIKEFKEFAVSGNVVDLGVGIVIGVAFKGIIDSFVADILTPLLGLVTGGIDFANRFIALNGQHFDTLEQAKKAGVATPAFLACSSVSKCCNRKSTRLN